MENIMPTESEVVQGSERSPEELLGQFNKEVADFFESKEIDINLKTYDSWDSLGQAWQDSPNNKGKTAPDWLVGFARDGVVNMLDPTAIPAGKEKDSQTRFEKVLKHEITHFYVGGLNQQTPAWMTEGTCIYVAKQDNYHDPETVSVSDLRKFDDHGGEGVYSLGHFMAHQIMDKFGKEKLLELISETDLDRLYQELKKMFDWLK